MSALLAVEEAQARLFALHEPLASENIAFSESLGRHLSDDVIALRDQPAAPISAMDGYAIRFDDLPGPWTIIGESAAGAASDRIVGPGEATRIFTGALLPSGTDTVIVQEDVARAGDALTLTTDGPGARGRHIRPRAADFASGDCLLAAGTRLTPGAAHRRREGQMIRLDPANSAYEPQRYPAERVIVQGRLSGLLRRYH